MVEWTDCHTRQFLRLHSNQLKAYDENSVTWRGHIPKTSSNRGQIWHEVVHVIFAERFWYSVNSKKKINTKYHCVVFSYVNRFLKTLIQQQQVAIKEENDHQVVRTVLNPTMKTSMENLNSVRNQFPLFRLSLHQSISTCQSPHWIITMKKPHFVVTPIWNWNYVYLRQCAEIRKTQGKLTESLRSSAHSLVPPVHLFLSRESPSVWCGYEQTVESNCIPQTAINLAIAQSH